MESITPEHVAFPKTQPTRVDGSDIETFLLDVRGFLLNDEIQMLATALNFKPAELDKLERSEDPGYMFVHLLKRKGVISRTNVSVLTETLKFCGLHGVADDVNNSFERYQSQTKLEPREAPDKKEKKTQFVTELKNKYKNLCGGIQPAPFLRDKYDIDELFVESGIEFLEENCQEGRDKAKWKGLKKYKSVFTDPRLKSKRRIIDGEPGYGKSTLALQITHDWCKELPPMTDFEIVILLRLRQFRNLSTVYSAIKRCLLPKDSKLTEADIESILDNSSTLILLDGYDEYPDRGKEDTDIELIIRGDMFLKQEVVLTTRTSCLPPNCSRDTKRIRLTGFDDASRKVYVRTVVARGCSSVADKISEFIKLNPVPADLCRIPLFFAMISYMVNKSERFRHLKTVTQFFRHVIKCFHSHKDIKVNEGNKEDELDHSKLDEAAFEGLNDDVQQISWGKKKLRGKIGKELYDEYVRIGILIEEECFDYDSLEYKIETRFFHKLFGEWFAAHHLAKLAAQSEVEFEPCSGIQIQAADTPQPQQAANSGKVYSLRNLNPHDVHYVYRYACGLNYGAAVKIIKHLATKKEYDQYTLLCMTEWGGKLEAIMKTVTTLCSRQIHISDRNSLLLQRSTVELMEFASSRQVIPISRVVLLNCLDVGSTLRVRPSNISLPVIDASLTLLWINELGLEITEKDTSSILQYSAKCLGLKKLLFWYCLLPQYIKVGESVSALRSRHVEVVWIPGGSDGNYHLNFESGQWEYWRDRKPMTEEQYQQHVEYVRMWSEERNQRLGED
ncbi:NLR family CARD domain-containing protein 4 [Holothuria leucospilota]|uniref:NLR family CARD domain-containing protein 4 n=1 Tax=Holothuria leucospilota TaxID=206669 RepID=A0A9Q1CR99_HOLLE|nr:NLR family CARD domain-containing protein 4 [Holothuria leucospilota]